MSWIHGDLPWLPSSFGHPSAWGPNYFFSTVLEDAGDTTPSDFLFNPFLYEMSNLWHDTIYSVDSTMTFVDPLDVGSIAGLNFGIGVGVGFGLDLNSDLDIGSYMDDSDKGEEPETSRQAYKRAKRLTQSLGTLPMLDLREHKRNPRDNCAICLEKPHRKQKLVALPCGHYYHRRCIHKAFAAAEPGEEKCPMCRRSVG